MIKILSLFTCVITATALATNFSTESAKAQELQDNLPPLEYCSNQRREAAQQASQTDVSGNYGAGGVGGSVGHGQSSSETSEMISSCDTVLEAYEQVTISQVLANRDYAIAVLNGEVDKARIDAQIMSDGQDLATRAFQACLEAAAQEPNGLAICQHQYRLDMGRIEARDRFQRLNNSR